MVDRRGWSSLEACGESPQKRPWLQVADAAAAAAVEAVFTFARCKESHYEYQLAKEGRRAGWARGAQTLAARTEVRSPPPSRRTEPRIGRFARRTTEGDRERRVDGVAAAAEKRGEKEKRTFLADFE